MRIAVVGAAGWGFFSLATGFAPTVGLLVVARVGSRRSARPSSTRPTTRCSPTTTRPRSGPAVYGVPPRGQRRRAVRRPARRRLLGARCFGWRVPFLVLAIPTIVLVVIAAVAAARARRAAVQNARGHGRRPTRSPTEETPPSLRRGLAHLLRRSRTAAPHLVSLPFLASPSSASRRSHLDLLRGRFGLERGHRGLVAAVAEPFQLVGLARRHPDRRRLVRRDPGSRASSSPSSASARRARSSSASRSPRTCRSPIAFNVAALGRARSPSRPASSPSSRSPSRPGPGPRLLHRLALAAPRPARPRIIGGVADAHRHPRRRSLVARPGLPRRLLHPRLGRPLRRRRHRPGAHVGHGPGRGRSAPQARRQSKLLARQGPRRRLRPGAGALRRRLRGRRGRDRRPARHQRRRQVDAAASRSPASSPATAGAVIFDGDDITHAAAAGDRGPGIVQVPGGKGVFPGLTVAENLRLAGWLHRSDQAYVRRRRTERGPRDLPGPARALDQPAGNLSGGEQQMLALGQAFLAKPRLLMIDELSLGLAPVIVEQLLDIVRAIRDQGTTIILVEQSVNVALTVAETAYFMEKGEIRFQGPTAELLERPDVLRSVFLEGAGAVGRRRPSGQRHQRHRRTATPSGRRRVGCTRRALGRRAADGPSCSRPRASTKRFGGITAVSTTCRFDARPGRDPRHHRPERRRQDHPVRPHLGLRRARRRRASMLDGLDVTDAGARRPGPPRPRPLLPGRPPVPGPDRARDDRRSRSSASSTCAIPWPPRCTCPPWPTPSARSPHRVDELIELLGLGPSPTSSSASCRPAAGASSTSPASLAHEPDGDPPRRAVVGHRPARDRGARPAAARASASTTGASLLVIEHDMPLITAISDRLVALDLGRVVTDGPAARGPQPPAVVASYLGTDDERHRPIRHPGPAQQMASRHRLPAKASSDSGRPRGKAPWGIGAR